MVSLKKIKQRILSLVKLKSEHDKSYYENNSPLISDFEYDSLVKELEFLAQTYPDLMPGKVIDKVGGKPSEKFKKIKHNLPMQSLDNSYSFQELRDFDKRITKLLIKDIPEFGNSEYCCELKIDGLAVSLLYVDGVFTRAITRGDGKVGEDVTENVGRIEDVPHKINYKEPLGVRGEVYLEKEQLFVINQIRKSRQETEFSNTRNAAAGTLRQLDSQIVADRKLRFFPYFLENTSEIGFEKHSAIFPFLKENGFNLNKYEVFNGIEEVVQYCEGLKEKIKKFPFDADGVVVKVNNLKHQDLLGANSKSPKWAIAYKFHEEHVNTIIKEVDFQVGRLGTITPVAKLLPVSVGGAVVNNATLHNRDHISEKGIAIKDEVLIKRAGEVIPAVVMVVKRPDDRKEIIFPEFCPACGTKLQEDEGQVAVYCPNLKCKGRLKAQLKYLASRDVFNISGLGEKLIDQFLEKGLVENWLDIFDLSKEQILSLARMGETSTDKLLAEIKMAKQADLPKIIMALGIKYVGDKSARIVADNITSLSEIAFLSQEVMQGWEGIGEKTASAIREFVSGDLFLDIINSLSTKGFCLDAKPQHVSNKLEGLSFVITGSLINYSRTEIKELIQNNKGKILDSVSKRANYLIVGDNPGSKMDKALEQGVPVIKEDDLMEMLK